MREPLSPTSHSVSQLRPRNPMQTTVLLVDDHRVVLEGLRALMESQVDIQVLGEAYSGAEAALLAKQLRPDVVLLDLMMPDLNGIGATRLIMKENPSIKVLVLSSSTNSTDVKHALDAGAAGYVTKQTAGDDLFRAIREVRRGQAFFSPAIAKTMQQQHRLFLNNGGSWKETIHLTPRETQVLQQIADGKSNKMIADTLAISIKTVEKHRQQLMEKTNCHEVAALTRYAVASGLFQPVPNAAEPTSAPAPA
jgi:DNA-binding NarL/FixJ family response regulator